MKIGVLTFWDTQDNYGQVLQTYSLQKSLQKLGHDAYLVRYLPSENSKSVLKFIKRAFVIFFSYKELKKIIYRRILRHLKSKAIMPNRQFDQFRTNFIKSTNRIYKIEDLRIDPPVADSYVCGSDQIWSWPNEGYYLNWVEYSVPRFSYAPSFGTSNLSKDFVNKIAPWLAKFKAITVREESGIKICKKAGINNVDCVLDPTFLLQCSDYHCLIQEKIERKKPYLLLYILNNKIEFELSNVLDFAKKENLEVIFISNGGKFKECETIYPTIEEWLSLFSRATYVITNSYHGTIFSILFNRKFLCIPLVKEYASMNDRIYSLLSKLNLTRRILENDLQKISDEIDYIKINEIIEFEREKALNMFKIWFSN